MIMKIIVIIGSILAIVHVLNILIHLWLLRRRNYAEVPKSGYDDTYDYLWSDDDEK